MTNKNTNKLWNEKEETGNKLIKLGEHIQHNLISEQEEEFLWDLQREFFRATYKADADTLSYRELNPNLGIYMTRLGEYILNSCPDEYYYARFTDLAIALVNFNWGLYNIYESNKYKDYTEEEIDADWIRYITELKADMNKLFEDDNWCDDSLEF